MTISPSLAATTAHAITASVPADDLPRREYWMEVFGATTVPLVTDELQCVALNGTNVLAYLVSVRHLTPDQFAVFMKFSAARFAMSDIEHFMLHGMHVAAEGLCVVRRSLP